MADLYEIRDLGFRRGNGATDLRRDHGAAEEDDDFQESPSRTYEEVALLAREHDRVVRRVNALRPELGGGFAQTFPGVL
jgi:hypothetical protein